MKAAAISNWLKIFLYKALAPIRDRWQPLLIETILEKNFRKGQPFFFVQIGAHDGVQYDSLYSFVTQRQAHGLVVEPQPDFFALLQKNYAAHSGVVCLNKAIHPTDKAVTLYRVAPEKTAGLPDWSTGIASLLPDHHKKSGIPSSVIVAQTVAADHLMNVVREHYAYTQCDLLQIDTEGFDYEVLRQLDFKVLQPSLIKFEYINLSLSDAKAAIRLLRSNGYWCFHQGMDVIAVRLRKINL